MIRSRWSQDSTVTLVREATIEDVKTFERRKADVEDKHRTEAHMRFVAKYEDTGKEFLADLAYLRADGGWTEILDTAAKIQPLVRGEG